MRTPHPSVHAPKRHRHRLRIPAPRRLHARAVQPGLVQLEWRPVKLRGHQVTYDVYRDGRRIAKSHHGAGFHDLRVSPSKAYRYRIHARVGRHQGPASGRLTVHTPGLPKPPPPTGPTGGTLSQAMVDRMFWRAGFGPTPLDRLAWVGKPPSALVEHFLTAPYALAPTSTPATYLQNPIDPLASDPELQMEWLDRMQRTTNPFVERMNFFWHRHFAVSRDAGIPSSFLLTYRDRLRRYSDFSANSGASFHNLALEMTTQDAAMSLYLTGYLNQKNRPNENYAREFMELFTLGVTDQRGNPNYSQGDVTQLARAFTGYTLDQSTGVVSFTPSRFDTGVKTILGQAGAFDAPAAIKLVLSQPSHAPFLVNKLWNEFVSVPIPAATLNSLVFGYVASGYLLAPLLRGILSHPLIFDSLGEPAMIKPPVVYAVGVVRALGAPLKDTWQTTALGNMQQQPYHPPNVAGWEGGASWMTTATATARFDLVVRCQGLLPAVADVPTETPQAALGRAYAACGSPWLSAATASSLLAFAGLAPTATAAQRRERYYALCGFVLGGPDGQVM